MENKEKKKSGGIKLSKILVVDDEENIRTLIKEELEDAGYEVFVRQMLKRH